MAQRDPSYFARLAGRTSFDQRFQDSRDSFRLFGRQVRQNQLCWPPKHYQLGNQDQWASCCWKRISPRSSSCSPSCCNWTFTILGRNRQNIWFIEERKARISTKRHFPLLFLLHSHRVFWKLKDFFKTGSQGDHHRWGTCYSWEDQQLFRTVQRHRPEDYHGKIHGSPLSREP